ncbi:MAG: nuclear transport factor 2 family protein [Actinobacteria bacterium]|nr:nuclear transport factor 2 family protein [Actinomycetota bacterium]
MFTSKFDVAHAGRLVVEDGEVSGRNQTAGDYHGVDEVLGFFGKLIELSGRTFRVELHDAVANDQHAIALSFFTAQRNGKTLDRAPGNEIYHVSNGRVREAWFGVQDPYEADEFWT